MAAVDELELFDRGPGHGKQAVRLVGDDLDARNWAVAEEQRRVGAHCDVVEVEPLAPKNAVKVTRKCRARAKVVHGKVE